MKNNTAIIFPYTLPSEHLLIPLVLVFDQVVYSQPVENDDSRDTENQFCETLAANTFCSFHTPAPLGENGDRFLKLINDIRTRQDDYAAQLTNVSLAGLSAAERPDSETKGAILSNLLSEHGIKNSAEEKIEQLLWQARLVLKLGEQFDAEHESMKEQMRVIKQRESSLFSDMVTEEGSPFALTGKLNSLAADTGRMQLLRLKAWSRLFAFGSDRVAGRVFISDDQDAVGRLCDYYEAETKNRPNRLCRLDLPLQAGKDELFLEQVNRFRAEEAELLGSIALMLNGETRIDDQIASVWNVSLDKWFPEPQHARCRLELNILHGVHPKHLFLDCFGHDEGKLEESISSDNEQDIVVGLLS